MDLLASSRWRCIDFISDLHLHASDPSTFLAWSNYLQHTAADAVFILGDLFDVWVGDDILTQRSGFEAQCAEVLRKASQQRDIYIMPGNRDFLMGPALMAACGCTLLDDPSVLALDQQRWLLTHGDALCLDDIEYQQFRVQVRGAAWQSDFLAKPLPERIALARTMRAQSEERKHTDPVYADVDAPAAHVSLQTLQAHRMIHGHTHRPGRHALGVDLERLVLSDWDAGVTPARAEVLRLRLSESGTALTVERIPPTMAAAPQKRSA